MSDSQTAMEEDAALTRKRKWIETVADEMQLGNPAKRHRFVAEPPQQQAALAQHYDDLLRNNAFAPEEDAQSDDDMPEDESQEKQAADPTEALLQGMRFAPVADDTQSDDEGADDDFDDDAVMTGIDPTNEIPAATNLGRRRIVRARRTTRPLRDTVTDPLEASTLLRVQPHALEGRDKGSRQRVATAYGLLAHTYIPKNATEVQATDMPDMVVLPQTEQLRLAYESIDETQRGQTDYDFFLFDDPDASEADAKMRDLSWDRPVGQLQGPHTVAHIALATAMRQRKEAMGTGAALAERNTRRRMQIDEIMAVGHVVSPQEVREILVEEEPDLYKPGSTAAAPVFADTVSKERQKRITRYANSYTEIYNQVISLIAQLSDEGGAYTLDETTKAKALEAAYDRIEELMNLSPYQTYGWRGDDAVIGKKEIGGKAEAKMKNRLYGSDKITEEMSADQYRISGMARLVDGLDPNRMFKNRERYRAFLVQRIEFLLGDDTNEFTARALRSYELDDLYDMMIDEKMRRLNELRALGKQ